MPEHNHGASEALVLPQRGRVVLQGGAWREVPEPGTVVVLGIGERMRLANAGPLPASLLAIFASPNFVRAFKAWPPAGPARTAAER